MLRSLGTCAALVFLLATDANAQTRGARAGCETIKAELATGKTPEQVAAELHLSARYVRKCSTYVSCETINGALASGKTSAEVAAELNVHPGRVDSCLDFGVRSKMWGDQPVRWSTCAAIDEAVKQGIAMGKTIRRVAAEINVDELRAEECHDCFASGAEAEALSGGSGDVDGDGKKDTLTVRRDACDIVLVADLTRLGRRTLPMQVAVAHNIKVLGVRDIDRNRHGEVFMQTDRGASTVFFTLYSLVDDQLVQMTLDGAPVGFGLGGSVTHFDSIGCGTGKLVTTSLVTSTAETLEDQSTSGTRETYALDGPRLRLLEKSTHDFGSCLHPEKGCPSAAELRAAGYDIRCDPIPFN